MRLDRGDARDEPAPGAAPDFTAWRALLDRVRAKRPALASVLEHAVVLAFGPERIALGYDPGSFLLAQASEASAVETLRAAAAVHFGAAPAIAFEALTSRAGRVTVAQIDGVERKARLDAARRAVAEHPLVVAAIELFGAELRDVRLATEVAAD